MGGLGIFSTSVVINYAFLASRLQIGSPQAKILANSDLFSSGPAFEWALALFRVFCDSNAFSLNNKPLSPYDEKVGRCLL